MAFTSTQCGHCHTFKGLKKDGSLDPKGAWGRLTSDEDLARAGVEFVLYQVGPETDSDGKKRVYVLEDKYKGISGYPTLRLYSRDEKEYITFNPSSIPGGWETSAPYIKKWILEHIDDKRFKVSASNAPVINHNNAIEVPEPVARRAAPERVGNLTLEERRAAQRSVATARPENGAVEARATVVGMGTVDNRPVVKVAAPVSRVRFQPKNDE